LNIEQYYRPSHKCLTYEYSKPLYLPILQSLCLTIRHHLSNNFTDNHRNKATLLKKQYDPQGYRYNVVMIYFWARWVVGTNILLYEEFEDTKGVIRIRISKKNRQHNGQKKKYKGTNNNLQDIHTKLKIE
jgi:hypothetical protein